MVMKPMLSRSMELSLALPAIHATRLFQHRS